MHTLHKEQDCVARLEEQLVLFQMLADDSFDQIVHTTRGNVHANLKRLNVQPGNQEFIDGDAVVLGGRLPSSLQSVVNSL